MTEIAMPGQQAAPGFSEQQLVAMDGTVLVSFLVEATCSVSWLPAPGMGIQGPCAGRVRRLPDGPWIVLAYFPDGYPGRAGAWPENPEIRAGLHALEAAPPRR